VSEEIAAEELPGSFQRAAEGTLTGPEGGAACSREAAEQLPEDARTETGVLQPDAGRQHNASNSERYQMAGMPTTPADAADAALNAAELQEDRADAVNAEEGGGEVGEAGELAQSVTGDHSNGGAAAKRTLQVLLHSQWG
jgi:hypothetical protein